MTIAIVVGLSALIVAIDQIIKYFIYENLHPSGNVVVIDNLFSLVYSENRGAAFGIFQNATLVFSIITIALIAVFLYLLISKKFTGKLFTTAVILIIGGGIGNLIDRIFRGFVIDYLSLSFFPPICNFADYCITIGAALFILCILFTTGKDSKKGRHLPDVEKENEPAPAVNADEENTDGKD